VACAAAPDTEQPVVEMRADRTFIYPQRMELSGEETLMDILDMYPDLLTAGFDDLLQGGSPFDGWQLRIDNVAVSGDLQANKQIFDHWDFHLQWHDMFYSKLSALLAGVAWRF